MLPDAELGLPEVQLMPTSYHDSEFYGASAVTARYCGFAQPPAPPRGYWMHGWGPKQFLEFDDPLLYFGPVDLHGKADYHWVSRRDEENLLRRHGYKHVKAIGLPIVYVPPQSTVRRPGSLLVMPAHSSEDTTSDWRFEEYADEIQRIRPRFSEVWVCIHPSCWDHGYWVDAFRKRGFPVVQGANYLDRNALERLCRLFSRFEYVTTNAVGSHIAYALYQGAKTSIYGSFAGLEEANYNNIDSYQAMLKAWEWARSEKTMRQFYPQLFCHPAEAKVQIDLGRYEVGDDCKVAPEELRSLFGWTLGGRCQRTARRVARTLRVKTGDCVQAVVPWRYIHRARLRRDATYRQECELQAEKQRLERLPRYTPASTTLLGGKFAFVDSRSFLAQYKAIFEQQIYRFESRAASPRILDGGANVGLSVLYFKRAYPKSRLTAFEPDPDLFQVLSKNCAAYQLEHVDLVPKALWTATGTLPFDREGADAGRLITDGSWPGTAEVATCRLKDHLAEAVDLLKLDLEGAELDVLLDCADALENVRSIVVEYHSFHDRPQQLHRLTELLHDAGFRLHLNPGMTSPQPLWWRQVHQSMDMRLYIYGYRPRTAPTGAAVAERNGTTSGQPA